MTEKQINELKKEGAKTTLLSKCSSALFLAKRHIEDADKDDYREFAKSIEKARAQIDEAEQLWRETYNL